MLSRSFDKVLVFLSLCILYHTMEADSKPLSRRSVSEVQLMHASRIHRHEQERQDWLQVKMLELHTAPRHALPEHEDVTISLTSEGSKVDLELY